MCVCVYMVRSNIENKERAKDTKNWDRDAVQQVPRTPKKRNPLGPKDWCPPIRVANIACIRNPSTFDKGLESWLWIIAKGAESGFRSESGVPMGLTLVLVPSVLG